MVMQGTLYPVLPILSGEAPSSYVSRLALLHDRPSTREFCLELGFALKEIADGKPDAMRKLDTLVGATAEQDFPDAITRDWRDYRCNSQKLASENILRGTFRFCAACVHEDVVRSELPPRLAAYARSIWRLSSVYTCVQHNIALSEVAVENNRSQYDASAILARILPDVKMHTAQAAVRHRTDFERYQLDRIAGRAGYAPWLDQLEFHVAVKFCQILGTVAKFGPAHQPSLVVGDDLRLVGETGFEISKQGETGIYSFLLDLQHRNSDPRYAKDGPQANFGALYKWLNFQATGECYNPLRSFLRSYIAQNYPLAAGTDILGEPIPKRVLFSIYSAANEIGAHPKRLRKILAAHKIIPDDHARFSDHRVTFSADIASPLLEKIRGEISLTDLETYMNAGRAQVKSLEINGFIRPFYRNGRADLAFARVDIDEFLAKLLHDARPVKSAPEGAHDIPGAARRANCGQAEIINLILDRMLEWIGRSHDVEGFLSVLVKVEEIKRHVHGLMPDALPPHAVTDELKTTDRVVRNLITTGLLPTRSIKHPINRVPTTVIDRADIEAFRQKYVSLFELSTIRADHFTRVQEDLAVRGIQPALTRAKYGATFYFRNQTMMPPESS